MIDISQLEMFINQQKNIQGVGGIKDGPSALKEIGKEVKSFKEILDQEQHNLDLNELKFSNHAVNRLHSRGINLNGNDRSKIVDGIKKLQSKGAKESLMLLDKVAMIVSVPNKTVVTVVDNKGPGGDGIFTNIDSTIVL